MGGTEMKKISIIVPVYNAEKGIRECVASLLSQNYSNIEIILVNDGSKDNSLEICNSLAEKDSRIIVHDGPNQGVSCARNKGIAAATGEYIAFVDADDLVNAEIYTKLLECAEKNKSSMTFCNYTEFNDFGHRLEVDQVSFLGSTVDSVTVMKKLISIADDALFGVVWRTLFKADLVKRHSFTPGLTMAEDLQFLLMCLKEIDTVAICPEYLYEFRVSNQSTTGKYMNKQDGDMRYVNDWMLKYVKDFKNDSEILTNVKICMANTIVLNIANVCKTSTPYTLLQRFCYAYRLIKEEEYKDAIKVSVNCKKQISKKRYSQILFIYYRMAFVNVLFHSIKNHTVFAGGKS